MSFRAFIAAGFVLSTWAGSAAAQINVMVSLPQIVFETRPPLVVVMPGVQVVSDHDEEVFFVDQWYWVRRDSTWFRTRDHRGGWVVVQPARVPARIARLPPGQYKHWKGNGAAKGPNIYVDNPGRDRPPVVKAHKGGHGNGGKGKHGRR